MRGRRAIIIRNQVSIVYKTRLYHTKLSSGTVTLAQSFDKLCDGGHVKHTTLPDQIHPKKSNLLSAFRKVNTQWNEEKDMYDPIIKAIRPFYAKSNVCVVNTHSKGDFRADISISAFDDDRVPYFLWYFIELKLPSFALATSNNRGQIFQYCHKLREKQPY